MTGVRKEDGFPKEVQGIRKGFFMKKRIVSIEVLRILAMMMVVMLHYLGKGNLLPSLTGELQPNHYVAWAMESFCVVAVNVYMLISGYFLVESGFKAARLVELLCQVLFYTLLIPMILFGLGVIGKEDITIYVLLQNILPIQMNHYWFMNAYVVMYLFSPILSVAAKTMKKEQLKGAIIALLLFFSVSKTVLPVQLSMDNRGNDGLWFICVYLVAAYIRLYGIPFFAGKNGFRRSILCYLGGCAGIYVLTFAIRFVHLMTGKFDYFVHICFDYNHVLNLFAAVGLFYAFLQLKLSSEGRLAKIVYFAAPYSLGVYLFHEQMQLRMLWPHWLGASADGHPVMFVLRCIGCVLLVYLIGTLVDACRSMLFHGVKRVFAKNRK